MSRKIGAFKTVPALEVTRPPSAIADTVAMFDGHCGLCTGWIGFLVKHDKSMRLQFAPLQSTRGRALQAYAPHAALVVKQGEYVFTDSRAVIELLVSLGSAWKMVRLMQIVPARVADWGLHWVSRNRHRFVGKPKPCKRKDPATAWRFLQDS